MSETDLIRALEPLAALAEKISPRAKDEDCWCGQDGAVIRYRDIRFAAKALAAHQSSEALAVEVEDIAWLKAQFRMALDEMRTQGIALLPEEERRRQGRIDRILAALTPPEPSSEVPSEERRERIARIVEQAITFGQQVDDPTPRNAAYVAAILKGEM